MKSKTGSSFTPFLIITITLLIVLSVVYPLFRSGFPITDDGDWMIIRLSAFFQSLSQGQLPVRYLGRLFYNYGYPVANFLYPGYLYLGSLFMVIGLGSVTAVKLLFGVGITLGAIAAYLIFRQHFSIPGALFGMAVYATSPYIAFDIYKRGSVGEILAIAFGTLSFLGSYPLFSLILPFCVALLIISHNSVGLIYLSVLILYIIISHKFKLIFPIILGIMIAGFFWIPALFEQRYVIFNSQLISDSFRFFFTGQKYLLINPVIFLALGVLWILIKKKDRNYDSYRFFSFLFIGSVFMSSWISAPLWKTGLSLIFQFPYRFLSIAILAGSFLMASVFDLSGYRLRIIFICVFLLGFFMSTKFVMDDITFEVKESGFYDTNEASTTVSDEYLPVWVKIKPVERSYDPISIFEGMGTITLFENLQHRISAMVDMRSEGTIQINKIYYPGWGVTVDDAKSRISYDNPYGLMRIHIPSGQYKVFAEFRENAFRFIIDIISLIAVITTVIYTVIRYRKLKAV